MIVKIQKNNIVLFFKAIKDLGADKFFIEPIEEVAYEERFDREQYWITYYDTYNNGYNFTRGGAGRPVGNVQEIIELYKKFQSIPMVAKLSNVCWDTVQYILHENNIVIKTPQQIQKDRAPSVEMYTQEGELLYIFSSVTEAAVYVHNEKGTSIQAMRRHIPDVCRGVRKTAGGYIWKYAERKYDINKKV